MAVAHRWTLCPCARMVGRDAMRLQQQALQQSGAGLYDLGIPSGNVSAADKQQAAILLTERLLGTLLQGGRVQDASVHIFQGVPARCQVQTRQLATTFAVLPASTATCRVEDVSFPGKGGIGGGRYVFSDDAPSIAKRSPSNQVVTAVVEVCSPDSLAALLISRFFRACTSVQHSVNSTL